MILINETEKYRVDIISKGNKNLFGGWLYKIFSSGICSVNSYHGNNMRRTI